MEDSPEPESLRHIPVGRTAAWAWVAHQIVSGQAGRFVGNQEKHSNGGVQARGLCSPAALKSRQALVPNRCRIH